MKKDKIQTDFEEWYGDTREWTEEYKASFRSWKACAAQWQSLAAELANKYEVTDNPTIGLVIRRQFALRSQSLTDN